MRLATRWLLPAAALLAASLLTGCGGNASAATPVSTNQVDLPPSYRFDPPVIQVPAGTTVTWTNHDNFTHSVQVAGGPVHDMKPGQRATITFDQPGEFTYVCTYHTQNMKGRVVVTPR